MSEALKTLVVLPGAVVAAALVHMAVAAAAAALVHVALAAARAPQPLSSMEVRCG